MESALSAPLKCSWTTDVGYFIDFPRFFISTQVARTYSLKSQLESETKAVNYVNIYSIYNLSIGQVHRVYQIFSHEKYVVIKRLLFYVCVYLFFIIINNWHLFPFFISETLSNMHFT